MNSTSSRTIFLTACTSYWLCFVLFLLQITVSAISYAFSNYPKCISHHSKHSKLKMESRHTYIFLNMIFLGQFRFHPWTQTWTQTLIRPWTQTWTQVETAFRMFDVDQDGFLSWEEFQQVRSLDLFLCWETKQPNRSRLRRLDLFFLFFLFFITNRPGLLEAKVNWIQTCKSVECSTNQFSQFTNTRYCPNVCNRWGRTRQWAKNKHLGYSRDATRWQRKSFL